MTNRHEAILIDVFCGLLCAFFGLESSLFFHFFHNSAPMTYIHRNGTSTYGGIFVEHVQM